MSERRPAGSACKLANGPYAERADSRDSAFDRWLSTVYARWLMPTRWHVLQAGRFVDRVDSLGAGFALKNDAALAAEVARLSRALRRQGMTDGLVAEAFALVRELSSRVLGKRHYRVQLMGALAMIRGQVAEMATGEGKTLTATLAAGVAAMAGIPTHILTVNEYLATRDAEEMGPLFEAMGFSVGVVQAEHSPKERQAAYAADITYCTNKDVGFDYLRDRLKLGDWPSEGRMALSRLAGGADGGAGLTLRGLHYCIVDEADSILVDEARTPLIISGQQDVENVEEFEQGMAAARAMALGEDFTISPEDRAVRLTERGKARIAEQARRSSSGTPLAGRLALATQALSALHVHEKDKHYLVREGKVEIVDEFTGRVMPDRSWEGGLHQMVELKEGCELTGRRKTLAKVTYQRLFRRYLRLSGMTGTGLEVADELWAVYRLKVARIPTHRPRQRKGLPARILPGQDAKWQAVIDSIREQCLEQGRPVLVGTRSVEASERLSRLLDAAGIAHQVLNARQDADEAKLIAQAGQPGVVTVATNMAGRGTDIKLGPGVAGRGGLHVILTEYHESARIDRQLFGRSGRQGDPGSYQSIVAADDEIFQVFLPGWLRHAPFPAPDSGLGGRLWRGLAQAMAERHHAATRRQTLELDMKIDQMLSFVGKE